MSRLFSWIVAAALTTSVVTAQAPEPQQVPPERPALKAYEYDVMVSGCIKGKRVERPLVRSTTGDDLPLDALNATIVVLEGPKELLKQIADDHKNHHDEILGIAIVPPSMSQAQAAVKTKRVGPISMGIGGRQDTSPMQSAAQTVKLKVSSIVHIQEGCPSR